MTLESETTTSFFNGKKLKKIRELFFSSGERVNLMGTRISRSSAITLKEVQFEAQNQLFVNIKNLYTLERSAKALSLRCPIDFYGLLLSLNEN